MKFLCLVLLAVLSLPIYGQAPPVVQPVLQPLQLETMPARLANGLSEADEILDATGHLEKAKRLDPADARRARNLANVAKETLGQAKTAYFGTSNDDRVRAAKMVEAAELTIAEARNVLAGRQRRP